MTVCFSLAQEDAVDWLRGQPAESVDLIVTDPAYESLEKHRARGTTTRLKHSKASSNDWFKTFPNARFPQLLTEMYRVLKRNTHCYIFCDQETGLILHKITQDVMPKEFTFKKFLVWDKKKIGMGYSYRARHEWIMYLEKGKRKLNNLGVADVIEHPRVHNGYPTEKPVEVCEVLIMQSSLDGDLVIDPFCGSGSTGVAATLIGRHFAGSDICEEALGISRGRLHGTGAAELQALSPATGYSKDIMLSDEQGCVHPVDVPLIDYRREQT